MIGNWSRARFIAVCAALLGMTSSPARADTARDPTDVLGAWTFQTKPYRQGTCSMSGTMRLSADQEAGQYQCEITAVEVCSDIGRSVVVQSCTARRFGNQVSVRSVIEQMLESDFEGLNYVPDNFALTIESPVRMYGALVSAVTAPVEFIRAEDGIS